MAGQLQDPRSIRRQEKLAAMGFDNSYISDRPMIGRTGSSATASSADSDETISTKEKVFNIFGHRRKKRSRDLTRQVTGALVITPPLVAELPGSTLLSAASEPEMPFELPQQHKRKPSWNNRPEPKTNLSANDILFGGRRSIPPPPPPKTAVPVTIANIKEDPIMALLAGSSVVKTKTQAALPPKPRPTPLKAARQVPIENINTSILARADQQQHVRKSSQGSDFGSTDSIQDKKRQHWLCPESPQREIINEKLYNELPLDVSEVEGVSELPDSSIVPPPLLLEKDPSLFTQPAPAELDAPSSKPIPVAEESPTLPEFTSDLKTHLRKSDLVGDWWRSYEPPHELSYIPSSTAQDLLNLYNDEQLEYDIRRIQNHPTTQPALDVPEDKNKSKEMITEEETTEEGGCNSHRGSTHTANGTIFSRRSVATTATSLSETGNSESTSPTSPQPAVQPRWTTFSKWGPTSTSEPLPAYTPMRESVMKGQWSPRINDKGCAMCGEELSIKRMIVIDCEHKYCNGCLRSIVLASLNDEISFPPKCCSSRIPVRAIRTVCNPSEQGLVNHKIREYSQAPEDRLYCPTSSCGRYIPPESVPDFRQKCAQCPFCQTRVCQLCRGHAHIDGAICPKEECAEEPHSDSCEGISRLCTESDDEDDDEPQRKSDYGKTRLYASTIGNAYDFEKRVEELEIASAIADVEEFEIQTILEQRAVDEALKVRRDAEKLEEKRRDEARMTDLTKKYDKLTGQLESLLEAQASLMEIRLSNGRRELLKKHEETEIQHERAMADEDNTLDDRVKEKSVSLTAQLDSELKKLDARFEVDEDDIIMVLAFQHRGKPNRDERINAARERLQHQQQEEKEELKSQFSSKFTELKSSVISDIEQAKSKLLKERECTIESQYCAWREAARREYADEKWFEAIREIRREHLAIQFEAQKDEYRMRKLEAELEESFKLAMMLELEDEHDRANSSPRGRDTPYIKLESITV